VNHGHQSAASAFFNRLLGPWRLPAAVRAGLVSLKLGHFNQISRVSVAARLNLETQIVEVKHSGDAAFASIVPSGVTAIAINNDPMMLIAGARIAENAIERRLPTIVFIGWMAKTGVLMSYGPNIPAIFRRSATYVDKILKDARPADLPMWSSQRTMTRCST
jgi:putative tryptophan/tyrosine transport system substrate-binding protein